MQTVNNFIWFGLLGGALPDVLRLINDRYNPDVPLYFKSPKFWAGILLLMGLGALVTWLIAPTTAMQAVLTGYSAPSILSKLAAKADDGPQKDKGVPDSGPGRGGSDFSLQNWWSR